MDGPYPLLVSSIIIIIIIIIISRARRYSLFVWLVANTRC
jgi:hypothetical protein